MRYDSAELRDRLAAEYALGTLRGRARRRFERLMRAEPAMAEAVERWEMRLNPLAEAVPPLAPPRHLWRAIAREIKASEGTMPRITAAAPRPARPGLWQSLGFWRGLGLAATAAAAALALYVGLATPPPAPGVAPLAVLADQAGRAGFVVAAEPAKRQLVLRAATSLLLPPGKSYELWLLPKGGAAPRSLGLVSGAAPTVVKLTQSNAAALPEAAGLAISLEPAGGSPTGQPTGPVLYQGMVLAAR
jgi:anti-sigma-K factor RskA